MREFGTPLQFWRRSRWKPDIFLGGLALACVMFAGWRWFDHSTRNDCRKDFRARRWATAMASCEMEFWATGECSWVLDAARSALYLNRVEDVRRLASHALDSVHAGDAHQLLGAADLQRGLFDDALRHLNAAAALHNQRGDDAGRARDAHQMAGVWFQLGKYEQALAAAAIARESAERARDRRMQVFIDIMQVDILRAVGALEEAEAVIEDLLNKPLDSPDLVWALLKRGVLYLDSGRWGLARQPLTAALREERAATSPRKAVLESLALQLAFVEQKAGAFERALQYIEEAKVLGTDEMSYCLNRGIVLASIGRLSEAAADLDAAEAAQPRGQWKPWVAYQRALVASRMGNDPDAEKYFRVAIERMTELAQNSGVWGPTLIANYREPHLQLIGLLAKRSDWIGVLEVVATMDAQALLESKEMLSDLAPSSLTPATNVTRARPSRSLITMSGILKAWRGRHLVVLVPAGTRVIRLTLHNGQLQGADVGDAKELTELALRLEADPSDLEVGRRLGEVLLPAISASGERIDLLLVGPIARTPIAALRYGAKSALSYWQLARVLGVIPRSPVHVDFAAGVIAIGDPTKDLPRSAVEAERVAKQLGGQVFLQDRATRAAFRQARGAALLHIAAHTLRKRGGPVIQLNDGSLSAADVELLQPAPHLVVLASCSGSIGHDDAGNGSLAAAFLDAGADAVVATRLSVIDLEAAELVDAFYRTAGDRDPLRALTEIQLHPPAGVSRNTAFVFEVIMARPNRSD